MKLTFKLKTGVLLAAAFIIVVIGVFYFAYSSRESDRLVDAILAADPLGDDSIYVDPQGFGGVSPAIENKQSIETVISYIYRMMEDYPEHIWTRNNSEYSLAQMYRKEDKFEEALELYKKVAEGETHHKEQAKQWVSILSQPDEAEQSPSISGKVWLGDQPASKVYVYVREKDANSWYSNPIGTYQTTVTNKQGEYTLYDVVPGDYYVGIGLAPKRLEGYVLTEGMINYVTVKEGETSAYDVHFTKQMTVKHPIKGETIKGPSISFSWEPYPGADAYRLTIEDIVITDEGDVTQFGGLQLHENWKEPRAEYNIEELRQRYFGTYIRGNTEGLSPSSVLGIVYPGGKFMWSVDAYDQHGMKLSSSRGIYSADHENIPFFSLDQELQLRGDVHVIKQDFDKAIAAYEKEMEHPYALRALAMIYRSGIEGDRAKSLEYMERIKNPTVRDKQIIETLQKELE